MFGLFKKKNDNIISKEERGVDKVPIVNSFKYFSVEKLKNLKDDEIYEYLKKSWEIEKNKPIRVFGYVDSEDSSGRYFTQLFKVYNLNQDEFEYPIASGLKNLVNEVFLEFSKNKSSFHKQYIYCNLILSEKKERTNRKNPLLLKVDKKSIEVCKILPEMDTIEDETGKVLVGESVFNHYVQSRKSEINKELLSKLEEKGKVKQELSLLIKTREKEERTILQSKNDAEVILLQIENQKIAEHDLHIKLEQLYVQIEKDKKMREEKLKLIYDYVKTQAKPLLELEFISRFEYDKIMGNIVKEKDIDENTLDFTKDLDRDYSKSISHIQAHLFSKNTVYYRCLLEDYFATIHTNDLIILAGDSGSGKTNLVKKFAEVVGGVARIIPVKPNWTSSDDLLGYYNPLQKSYLSTPFLDALIEATENPTVPYFICLDEMNLARVEYYFADFLSLLEEREKQPYIDLYSDRESAHTISEFNHVLTLIEEVKKNSDKEIVTFIDIMKDEKVNEELKRVFGFGDKDSLIKYHSDLRRMISGVLNVSSSIVFPKNVRIIGTINIDETTHYLSPKILDRAHVIKLDSPSLSDWASIEKEVNDSNISNPEYKINFKIEDFGYREAYPKYDPEDVFCKNIANLSEKYLSKLGIEVSLRSVRQGLKYNEVFSKFNLNSDIAFNNFLLHKIFPKFTFDSNTMVDGKAKIETMESLRVGLKSIEDGKKLFLAKDELKKIINRSRENDGIVNYWA